MLSKRLSGRIYLARLIALAAVIGPNAGVSQPSDTEALAKFLGARSCGSTGCHGGADSGKDQYLTWRRRDPHSTSYAKLTGGFGRLMADTLDIDNPATDRRCASCHAPFATVPPAHLAKGVKAKEGISCESCHGPAQSWYLGHTRIDWTRKDRRDAGMRGLSDLYERANACVACHQNLEPELIKAGHPDLIFELDGQSADQPRHWRRIASRAAGAWLTGQAVALREISWKLGSAKNAKSQDQLRKRQGLALVWLLNQVAAAESDFEALPAVNTASAPDVWSQVSRASDAMARKAAAYVWEGDAALTGLAARLCATSAAFKEPDEELVFRAERLGLAIDRLLKARQTGNLPPAVEKEMNALFALIQSRSRFNVAKFGQQLDKLRAVLTAGG